MKNLISRLRDVFLIILIGGVFPLAAQQHQHRHQHRYRGGNAGGGELNIVCSFSDYASIAEYIAGPDATVQFIAHGEQDPHFVAPKPSYAMMMNKADMWITTGMDLEIWSTTLLDKARNKQIMDGAVGFVSVSDGVNILQKVEKADRTEGMSWWIYSEERHSLNCLPIKLFTLFLKRITRVKNLSIKWVAGLKQLNLSVGKRL